MLALRPLNLICKLDGPADLWIWLCKLDGPVNHSPLNLILYKSCRLCSDTSAAPCPWLCTWKWGSHEDFIGTPMKHPVLHENGVVMETFYWDTYEALWLAVSTQKWDSHVEVLVCHPGFNHTNSSMELSSKQRIILTVAPGFNHTSWCNCPVNQGQC